MNIFVGSTNPVKIQAVKSAIQHQWPDAQVVGFDVPSGISEQPRTDEETRQGAVNRAKAALAAGLNQHPSLEALGVGLEGGVFAHTNQLWSTVWVAVTDQEGRLFFSNGARFPIPEPIASLISSGQEMGPAVAQLTGEADVRQKQGMIGVLTEGFVDRATEYGSIAKMAIGLWYGRNWARRLSGNPPGTNLPANQHP